ncbi:DUF2703 domain-containing protein [Halomonas sp. JS92-SW72]|uniref:DUF2703 domain-containing protein n=1 Tax=Halomonas sp. JS92-SW72 TaxID=2306583 RepID=UPI001969661F|nr:DUF2703 domain-containing protein [Halomonas sp. JS92-SW72]
MMKRTLPILWQRLVSGGETCDRCRATQREVEQAVETLKAALAPLGLEPLLEIRELDEATFRADPLASNRIWIAGRPMEEWLDADVGRSPCCSVCGDEACRTVEVEGVTYETIPESLLLRAALIAAASGLGDGGTASPA